MISLLCWIISPADYREIAIAIQFTNCTATVSRRDTGRSLARELALLGERAEAEPGLHRGSELAASGQHNPVIGHGRAHGIEAQPDRRHAPQVRRYVEV